MDLFGWIKKRAEGVVAQLNPFDGGADYNSVVHPTAPKPTPQQSTGSFLRPVQPSTFNPQNQNFTERSNYSTPIQGFQNPGATPNQSAKTLFNIQAAPSTATVRPKLNIGGFTYTPNPDGTYTSNTGNTRTQQQINSLANANRLQQQTSAQIRNKPINYVGDVLSAPFKVAGAIGNMGKEMVTSTGDLVGRAGERGAYVLNELNGNNQRTFDRRQSMISDADNMTQSFVNRARNATNQADYDKFITLAKHSQNQANALHGARDMTMGQNLQELDPRQVLADAGEAALDIATLGKGKAILEGVNLGTKLTAPVIKQLAKDTLISGAQGAGIGGAYGGVGTLRDPNATLGDYARNIGTGALLGSGLGVGAQFALPAMAGATKVVAPLVGKGAQALGKKTVQTLDSARNMSFDPQIREMNAHHQTLLNLDNQFADRGLSPNSTPRRQNAKAREYVLQQIQNRRKLLLQEGSVKVPFGKNEVPNDSIARLKQEALKYKSADEFHQAQTDKFYGKDGQPGDQKFLSGLIDKYKGSAKTSDKSLVKYFTPEEKARYNQIMSPENNLSHQQLTDLYNQAHAEAKAFSVNDKLIAENNKIIASHQKQIEAGVPYADTLREVIKNLKAQNARFAGKDIFKKKNTRLDLSGYRVYGERANSDYQLRLDGAVSNKVDNIVYNLNHELEGSNLSARHVESKSSTDANYIVIDNDVTGESYTIRIANHHNKAGQGVKADREIILSDPNINNLSDIDKSVSEDVDKFIGQNNQAHAEAKAFKHTNIPNNNKTLNAFSSSAGKFAIDDARNLVDYLGADKLKTVIDKTVADRDKSLGVSAKSVRKTSEMAKATESSTSPTDQGRNRQMNSQSSNQSGQVTQQKTVSGDSSTQSLSKSQPQVKSQKTSDTAVALKKSENSTQNNQLASTPKGSKIGTAISKAKATQSLDRKETVLQAAPQEKQLQAQSLAPNALESSRSYGIDNTTNLVKRRGLVDSIKDSNEVSTDVKQKVNGKYNVRSTSQLAESATDYANKNLKQATTEVNDRLSVRRGRITDQDVADALAVAKRLDHTKQYDASQQIYDKLAEHGTASGQTIQAFSLLKNRTPEGINFQIMRSLKKAGVVLSDQDKTKLGKLIEGIGKTKPNSEARSHALFNAIDFSAKRIPSNRGDKIINFWRAGLLTAPKTTGGNIVGNTTEALTRDFWANPLAAGADKLISIVTHKRTKTLSGGRLAGAKEGIRRGAEYLKTGYDPRNMDGSLQKFDVHKRINYKHKIVDNYVNGVYRWMGAQDQPFYYAAKAAAARDLAKADGMNLGYKGEKLAKYVEDSALDENWKPQTFKTAKDATQYAKYSVYQNDTMLADLAAGAKKAMGSKYHARWIVDFIMPFTQVPSSVAMRIIDRTPLGMAKEIVSQIAHKKFDQRALAESIGNGTFGIAVYAAAATLANSGLLTGAYPKDAKERKLWQEEGKQEYSVKVGNRWYSMNYLQPFGTMLSIGKQISDDKKAGKSEAEAWATAGGTAAKSVSDQSFLQGINGLMSAINEPDMSASNYVKSTASSFTPNFIRSLATATDSKQRDTKSSNFGKSVGNSMIGTIPGLRETLPAKQGMFGETLDSKDNPANMFLNPLSPSKAKSTDATVNELRRLQDTGNGIVTTTFAKNSIAGATLNDDQIRNLNSQVNSEVKNRWDKLISQSNYRALSDEDKATALKKVKDAVANNIKAQFVKDNRISSTTTYKVKDIPTEPMVSQGNGISTTINSSISPSSRSILDSYQGKSSEYRTKQFNTVNDAEYKYNLAKYENDKANGSLSVAQDIKERKSLSKEKIGSVYTKNIRDLYGLSKTDLYNYLSTPEKGVAKKDIANQLIAYDQALYNAGLTSYLKFKTGIAPSKGSGRGKSLADQVAAINSKFRTTHGKTTTGPKLSSGGMKTSELARLVALRKYNVNMPASPKVGAAKKVARTA